MCILVCGMIIVALLSTGTSSEVILAQNAFVRFVCLHFQLSRCSVTINQITNYIQQSWY